MKKAVAILVFFLIIIQAYSQENVYANKLNDKRDSLELIRQPIWFDIRYTLDSAYFDLRINPTGDYQRILSEINSKRLYYKNQLQDSLINQEEIISKASKYLEDALVNKIIPHWYNTPWDFNGYTNKPNEGVVACGYFVSTTLKHAGFNLNRYRFAQQYGKISGESLQNPMNIIPCEDDDAYAKLTEIIKKSLKNEGLYFVGLDCHVGYILYRKDKLFFIHSSYTEPFKVVIEDASTSEAFISSAFYFSSITTNNNLVLKWINGEELVIE